MSTALLTPHPLDQGHPPEWASEWGEDRHGVFVAFEVGGVRQRLRWIRPGTFCMGSPEGEAGRFEDESPRHLVTLTEGFWLGDTPCTQALWQAVMGQNPSRFPSPDRPVEQVSWEDCQTFLEKLNHQVPGLEVRLPTEAEWERACRAGTEPATWLGDLKILGENNAPLLDAIAWYGGNSGLEYDLEEGWDSSSWSNKQYRHKKAGTRRVKRKEPNPWGLYDVLGNVWEWCADWHGAYGSEPVTNPTGPTQGSSRVIRGGSWYDDARYVRAAARLWNSPGHRIGFVGFRLGRGQGPAPG
ncbi:MAG TPA: formylglycine-generating enzyme family protein [Thermoanaerobaculia bacterium]|nr:formylglycine-generating enzyme family protein [Thermoanaerobaculia bacterium]